MRIVVLALVWGAAVGIQAQAPKPQMAETVFKNVQMLKGIPVDEFMDVMGMFSASLGYDCVSCHSSELYNNRDAFAVATPMLMIAPISDGTLNVVVVIKSIQTMPAKAPGSAVIMMSGSVQLWKFTTIKR